MRHARCRPAPLIGALGIVLVGCRGEVAPEARSASDEPLLVVQDRGPLVVSGRDTTMVLAPTVFAWFDVTPSDPKAAPMDADALARFERSLREALN